MQRTETVIIGGGQAGLALSRCLVDRGRDHVVVERGRIGERWRSERWDSLRLLTPNWMTRLPGHVYRGDDPDGFMHRDEVVDLLEGYADSFDAPVEEETTVESVRRVDEGWRVGTDRGVWLTDNVVVATGHCDVPRVPQFASGLNAELLQLTTSTYRSPRDVAPGGVLVVGASASGVQLADEIRRAGHAVTLAVGRHNRMPRRYRGRDIMWWLDRMGILDRSISDVSDPESVRHEVSLQLVGGDGRRVLDLAHLSARGVRLAGRLVGGKDGWVRFAEDLDAVVRDADERLERLLARIDRYIDSHGLAARYPRQAYPPRVALDGAAPVEIDLRAEGISTVLWAIGFRRQYPWLDAPVLDARGEIVHQRGRTSLPGLYVLGMQFQTHRRSSFIDGVGRDAETIAEQITCSTCRWAAAA